MPARRHGPRRARPPVCRDASHPGECRARRSFSGAAGGGRRGRGCRRPAPSARSCAPVVGLAAGRVDLAAKGAGRRAFGAWVSRVRPGRRSRAARSGPGFRGSGRLGGRVPRVPGLGFAGQGRQGPRAPRSCPDFAGSGASGPACPASCGRWWSGRLPAEVSHPARSCSRSCRRSCVEHAFPDRARASRPAGRRDRAQVTVSFGRGPELGGSLATVEDAPCPPRAGGGKLRW